MIESTRKDILILSAPFIVCGVVAVAMALPFFWGRDYDGLRRWEIFVACGDDARRQNEPKLAHQFYLAALDESRDFRDEKFKHLTALARMVETEDDSESAREQVRAAINEAERLLQGTESDDKRVQLLSSLLGLWQLELDSAVRRNQCDVAARILVRADNCLRGANLELDYLLQNEVLSLLNKGFDHEQSSNCLAEILEPALKLSDLLSEPIRTQCSTQLWRKGAEYDTNMREGLRLVKKGDCAGGAARFHQAASCIESEEPRSLKAKALLWAALAEYKAGLKDKMKSSFETSLGLAMSAGDYPLEESISLAATSLKQGDAEHVRAQATLTASRLKIYGANSPGLKEELFGSIGALRMVKDLPGALQQAQRARIAAKERGDRDDEAEALFQIANIYEDMHDIGKAVDSYKQVVALMGDELIEPNLSSVFKLCSLSEEPSELLPVFPIAQRWLSSLGSSPFRKEDVDRCLHLARAYNQCEMYERSRDLSTRLLKLELTDRKTNQLKLCLARAYMGLLQLDKAESLLKQTLIFYRANNMPGDVFFALIRLSQIYEQEKNFDKAKECLNEALTTAKRCSNPAKKEAAVRSRLSELN